ncbi:hypothetical protein [Paraglaciecola sp. 2405UD69-4]|uniref:hypothetical protein n=1 Tax=Paraglaciecola sp. 2405UD69-4 TaxID=3391836 RepID=UPI0039C9D41A
MSTDDIYKAPEAELIVNPNDSEEAKPEFFTTAISKMVVLSVCTLNLYSFYWFYKHWTAQKLNANRDCLPVLRAIFQVFFVYSLFSTIKNEADHKSVKAAWMAGPLAVYYIVLQILQNASEHLPSISENLLFDSLFWIIFGLTSVIPMLVVQKTANILNDDPEGITNKKFGAANWVFTLIGVAFWGLMVVGLMLPAA